jgi:hypothetical protein
VVATVVPHPDWPRMYRVQMPDGSLTDMVNLARARDAAACLALGVLKGGRTALGALLMRSDEAEAQAGGHHLKDAPASAVEAQRTEAAAGAST